MDIKAYGKINLTLDVLYRRPDGYHQLRGVMCAVDVYDAVHMERSECVSVTFDDAVPPQNTAVMAARAFFEKTGRGADIYIQKGIPSEAGMGGASADAAGVLRGMNRLYGGPLSESELYSIGLSIGADVPFCLMGGCAVAEGIGEVLKEVQPEDLLKYGLIPEFVGRLPIIATLEDLDEAALVRVLTEPKNALVSQYETLFAMEDVKLTITHEAMLAIAHKAIERKTGARGLRAIMEDTLLNLMYEIPDKKEIAEIIIDEKVINDNAEPQFVYRVHDEQAV